MCVEELIQLLHRATNIEQYLPIEKSGFDAKIPENKKGFVCLERNPFCKNICYYKVACCVFEVVNKSDSAEF